MALNSFQLFLSQVQSATEELKLKVLQVIFDLLIMYEGDFLGRSEEIVCPSCALLMHSIIDLPTRTGPTDSWLPIADIGGGGIEQCTGNPVHRPFEAFDVRLGDRYQSEFFLFAPGPY